MANTEEMKLHVSFNREDVLAMVKEELQTVFEQGFKLGLIHAKDEGWAYHPGELEASVLAGNEWLAIANRAGVDHGQS